MSDINFKANEFYQKYYTADNMHLMVVSNQNLDHTQQMVENIFGNYY